MINLDSILKSRGISPTKVHKVKAMALPVVIYGCESWIIKKAEHQRTDALGAGEDFWDSLGQQGDQTKSILKEINLEYSLEELLLKLGLPNATSRLTGKDRDAGKDWRQEEKGW